MLQRNGNQVSPITSRGLRSSGQILIAFFLVVLVLYFMRHFLSLSFLFLLYDYPPLLHPLSTPVAYHVLHDVVMWIFTCSLCRGGVLFSVLTRGLFFSPPHLAHFRISVCRFVLCHLKKNTVHCLFYILLPKFSEISEIREVKSLLLMCYPSTLLYTDRQDWEHILTGSG